MFEESVSIWASMNSWFTPTVLFVFLNLMIGVIAITSSFATHKPSSEHQQPQQYQIARSPSVLQRLKSINFYSHASPNQSSESHYAHQHQHQHQEHEQEQEQQQQQPQLARSPSVLQRLKSINLYNYLTQEPTTTLTRTQEDAHYTPEKVYKQEVPEEEEEEDDDDDEEEEEYEEEEEEHIQEQEQTLDEVYGQLKAGTSSHVGRTKSDTKPASGEIPKKLPKKMKKSASSKSAFSHFQERDIVEARRPATVREGKAKATEVDDDGVDAKADDFINKFKQQLKLQRIDSILRYKETINRKNAE